jgi:hypothetical protein
MNLKSEDKQSYTKLGAAIAIGVGIGIALGVALNSIAIRIAIGVGIGLIFGGGIVKRTRSNE